MNFERLGPYLLQRRIGRGGMGTVFSAETDVTGEIVAVKVLSALQGLDDGIHDRFAAEIESLRMLHHPHIVRILGYGDEDGCRYYAMELVDGSSLQDAIDAGRKFAWPEVVKMGVQICRALKCAHDRGIVHRDIKPGNLLLTSDGTLKLSDFGIAKSFGNSGMTADGGVIGTAEYMSPEQAEGRAATHRSDLYSLGGVLYALLAGRPPFKAKNLLEMLQLQRFADPEPPLRFAPTLPRALNDLVLQLLHKDPTKRMPNAMMTARALEAVLAATAGTTGEGTVDAPTTPRPDADRAAAASPAALPKVEAPVANAPTAVAPGAPAAGDAEYRVSAAAAHGSIHATTDLRVAPGLAPRPVRPPSDVRPAPEFTTRTFTPIARDDHRQFDSRREDDAPAWISPQTWGLVAAMLTLGLLTWYWLQPPSPEKLYARVSEAAAQNKIERLLEVERDIHSFLEYYSMDRRSRELQTYLDEIDLYRLERKFEYRGKFLSKNEGLAPIERAYIEAIGYVHLDPALGRKKLQALVDLFREVPEPTKAARECLMLAQKQLDRLESLARDQAANDRELIEKQLARADAIAADQPETAERIRRAVIELYADEPWAESIVRTARTALGGNRSGIANQRP